MTEVQAHPASEASAASARARRLVERILDELAAQGLDRAALEANLARRMAAALRCRKRPYGSLRADLEPVPPLGAATAGGAWALQNRLLAAALAERFAAAGATIALPAAIQAFYPRQQARIVEGLEERTDPAFYHLDNEDFLKELAILSHRLVPYGQAFGDPWGRVPPSILFRRGLRQFVQGAKLFGLATHGFGPFFTKHMHALDLHGRNDPESWQESHHLINDILALNPGIRGEAGGGWIYDPRIATISPGTAYLLQLQMEGGATALFAHRDQDGASGALTASRTRRELFERGEYVPEIWICVWPRKKVERWARSHPRARPDSVSPAATPLSETPTP